MYQNKFARLVDITPENAKEQTETEEFRQHIYDAWEIISQGATKIT